MLSPGTWHNSLDRWTLTNHGLVLDVSVANPEQVKQSIQDIKKNIDHLNEAIGPRNENLLEFAREVVGQRMDDLNAQRQTVVSLADVLGAELVLTDKEERRRALAPRLKEAVASLRRPQPHPGKVVHLPEEHFRTILDVIDAHASSLERNPVTAAKLDEEDFRNLILSTLNGAFNLGAMGEVFSKRGKTDIFLDVPDGGVFIAECKIWHGPSVIGEGTAQILDYLTWKDAHGVLILFSRNKDLSHVLNSVSGAVSALPSLRGDVYADGDRHWVSRHLLTGDQQWTVELHHLVYNITDSRI